MPELILSTQEFLSLFHQKEELKEHNGFFNIFILPSLKSFWTQSSKDAAKYLEDKQHSNCFFTPAVFRKVVRGKGQEKDVIGLSGVYLDIDYQHSVHQKGNLPPTKEDALSLLKSCPLEPTIIIHTGHGLQVFWLFKETWWFDRQQELLEAKTLCCKVNKFFCNVARAKGWTLDSVFNLDRVLRVLGTFNVKDDNPVRVTLEDYNNDNRFNPDDFSEFLEGVVDIDFEEPGQQGAFGYNIEVNAEASPPVEKMKDLAGAEGDFMAIWYRQDDRPDTDNSPSSYDMRLAIKAAKYNWTPQEIADLIIAFRRQSGNPEDLKKGLRKDYLERTISKAFKHCRGTEFDEELERLSLLAEERTKTGVLDAEVDEKTKEAEIQTARAVLSNQLNLKVLSLIKYQTEPPVYALKFAHKIDNVEKTQIIEIGPSDRLLRQDALRRILFDATKQYIPAKKPAVWIKVCKAFSFIIEECKERPAEFNAKTMLQELILEYIEKEGISIEDDEYSIIHKTPFVLPLKIWSPKHKKNTVKALRIFMQMQSFKSYVWASYQESFPPKTLALEFTKMKVKAVRVARQYEADSGVKTVPVRAWELPRGAAWTQELFEEAEALYKKVHGEDSLDIDT